jgi:hypothetical protein
MKISKAILSCLILSLVFAAIATELSMRVSTNQAMSAIQQIGANEEDFSNWYIDSYSNPEQLKEQIVELQSNDSVYQYPGYWLFWLEGFFKVFITAFLVSMLQSYLVLRKIK